MSCTNSSNIQSNLITQVIREEASGKRVVFSISSADAGISSGVTLGSVIRYDVPTNTYVPSKADEPASSEVIGIVESIKTGSGSPVYTVVASGLIKYPNIGSVINSYGSSGFALDTGTGGEAGGADIFFLSDYADGKLQLLEPTESGHVVKPVMQKVSVGEYNGIVLNYIGYEVANIATSDSSYAFPAGAVYYAHDSEGDMDSSNFNGFLNVSQEQLLNSSEYPELYSIFGTDYGYYQETITVRPRGVNLNLLVDNVAVQRDLYGTQITTGTIVSVNHSANTITVKKQSTQPKTDLTKSIIVNSGTSGELAFVPANSTVVSFTVPSVPKQTINYTASSGSKSVQYIPYMRIRKDTTTVSIPNVIQISKLISDSIITQGVTVGDKLSELETRIRVMERRLGIE